MKRRKKKNKKLQYDTGRLKICSKRGQPFKRKEETKHFLDNSDAALAPYGYGMIWQRFLQTCLTPLEGRYPEYRASRLPTDAGNKATQCPEVVSLFTEISSKQWEPEKNTDAYFNQIHTPPPKKKSCWIFHTWRRLPKIRKLAFKLCYESINTSKLASRHFIEFCCLHHRGGYVVSRKDEASICTDGDRGQSPSIQENQENL